MKRVIIIASVYEEDLSTEGNSLRSRIQSDVYLNTDAVDPDSVIFVEELDPNDQKLGEQIRKHL